MASAGLCLLHCLALPVLIVLLPFFSWMDTGEETHQYLAAFALLFALSGLIPGYVLHRRREILIWGAAGWTCIAAAALVIGPRLGELAEALATIAGAAILFATHLRNRRLCRSCPA